MDQKYIESTVELMDFIQDSPSCYHVVANAATMLENAGAVRLDEKKPFELEAGSCYFVTRNSSSIIAFRMPEGQASGYSIVAAHTDSPSFKVKENPEITNGGTYTTLNVEAYGGMLMAPWFDRPLSIAGRAFVKQEDGSVCEKLVDFDKDLCQIINLCIHQNREANKGYEYKVQKDMLPIIGMGAEAGTLRDLVAELLEVEPESVIDTELFLYNRMKGSIWGLEDEFFSCPKIDDLQCAFSALKAFVTAEDSASDRIQMVALFDNEEVGSGTRQGAFSDFLRQVTHRIGCAMGWDFDKRCALQASSFMLSADNGHSMHPNYQEKCDPTNKPLINGGVMIKYAGNQKYTTDAYSGAYLKSILAEAGIPCQVFHNNSNVTGGGTLGNISSAQFSIPCVDIGAAQLAMHSPYETAGTKDTFNLTEGMKAFYKK